MTDHKRHEICPVDELPPGERVIVDVDGLSIGVFNVEGEYHAIANVCPHHLAPLCKGTTTGESVSAGVGDYEMVRDGEVIQCPWHGWKFDIATGKSVFNPHELRTRTFDVAVESVDDDAASSDETDSSEGYDTGLMGEEPPIDTYEVNIEREMVVLYL